MVVGDQIFADILAGNLAGVFTILVTPIKPEQEHWFTRIKDRGKNCFEILWEEVPRWRLERREQVARRLKATSE